jgi:RNA polymerase sigma factor (TIGR02999 family)
MASRAMSSELPYHTLRSTALVHEVYLRPVDSNLNSQDRRHFYAVAANAMRRILIDYARASGRQKRGGGLARVSIEDAVVVSPNPEPEIVALDEALDRLASFDQRKAEVVEMLFFGGFSYDEVAQALDISRATVHRK